MGLSSALNIGQSALAAYQAAMQIVGNNLANIGTPGYTRGSPQLTAVTGPNLRAGQLGGGVRLDAVRRNISEALQSRLRTATSDKQSATSERAGLGRIEDIFDPLGDNSLGSMLSSFFSSVSNLQNSPQDTATRSLVISKGQQIVSRIRGLRSDLTNLRADLNAEISGVVTQADSIASRIAELNVQITSAEAGGGTASGLRDQRDQLLGELSEMFGISVREQPSGAVNVYVGNDALVQFGQNFGLQAAQETNSTGLPVTVVRFKSNNGQVTATSGSVEGLISARDTQITNQLARLDSLAAGLIQEFNKVHAGGKGLQGFSNLTGLTQVTNPAASLLTASNGIAFPPKTGSFFIDVKDTASGQTTRHQIHIDLDGLGADSTLNSVAADVSANVPGVNATVLSDGRLQLTATGGKTFSFADDTSGFLGAVGVNTFFSGKDSSDIDLNAVIAGSPSLLAAAKTDLPGDGDNAMALAALKDLAVASLGGISINDFYTTSTGNLAASASNAQSTLDASSVIFDSLTNQRESISGVNVDEEAVSMLTYQRAFEGAARYMTVVDQMLQTLLGLVR